MVEQVGDNPYYFLKSSLGLLFELSDAHGKPGVTLYTELWAAS